LIPGVFAPGVGVGVWAMPATAKTIEMLIATRIENIFFTIFLLLIAFVVAFPPMKTEKIRGIHGHRAPLDYPAREHLLITRDKTGQR